MILDILEDRYRITNIQRLRNNMYMGDLFVLYNSNHYVFAGKIQDTRKDFKNTIAKVNLQDEKEGVNK